MIETIEALAGLYEELPDCWQVVLFAASLGVVAITLFIIVSLLSTFRILAEGIASFISLGRITFDETTKESEWKFPSIHQLYQAFRSSKESPKQKEE